ncbi:flotillin [Wenzhouxiangella sp. AB-CW3]|uniref:flotillin family protein n=1 Tax=Wenzhouxiangella sp. AB-CW3 TaxID=2771012 RepID=UPI00168AE286|nr:flotillin domain-containing protein [Wenzhouxiangella sp. AB-CW3]QOC21714.1 flotillin [Wenzhouxiangella sp. AB-CW3]
MNTSVLMTIPGIIVSALVAIGLIYAALYKKVPRGIALVRTGMGGRKVIIDGGCLRLPVFHEVREVNLSTVQLTVRRNGEDALITRDSLRVDATVDFYVSVEESDDGVAQAARTLGDRTFDPDKLRELIEGKLVDALRAVAAEQDMMNLHENRQDFVQRVQEIVATDLSKNGLQLESVSLTGLDQTSTDNLNPNNMFNATALKLTAERVARETQARAEAEANARIADAREAARAEEETIRARETVERSEIEKERGVAIYRSESQAESRKAEIASNQAAENAELEKDEALRARAIERDRKLKISEQEQRIAVAEKSESESQAQARAEQARQERVVAEEAVRTAQEQAAAERQKQVSVIRAQEEAEVDATRVRVSAGASREAVELEARGRSEAVELEARGRRQAAEQDKEAAEFRAQALRAEKEAEAEGIQAVNEAKNTLSSQLIAHAERLRELEVAPEVLRELVAPFDGVGENMRSVFIHGLGNANANGNGAEGGSGQGGQPRSVMEDLFGQIMNYSTVGPALKEIGGQLGIDLAETLKNGSLKRVDGGAEAAASDRSADAGEAPADAGGSGSGSQSQAQSDRD